MSDRIIFLPICSRLSHPPERMKFLSHPLLYCMRVAKECILIFSHHFECFTLAIEALNNLKQKIVQHSDRSSHFTDLIAFTDIITGLYARNIRSSQPKGFVLLELDWTATSQITKFVNIAVHFNESLENILFPLLEKICVYPANRRECMKLILELSISKLILTYT